MGLMSRGFPVTVISTATPFQFDNQDDHPEVKFSLRDELGSAIESISPDVLVMQHWGLMYAIPPQERPLIIDLAGPHLLERRYWGNPDPQHDLEEKLRALKRADFIICSGLFQRHYFIPFLMQAGFNLEELLPPVIPFSVPSALPLRSRMNPKGEITFVYGGAFLAWQNPELLLDTTLAVMDELNQGRLVFYGGSHPEIDASGGRFAELYTRLSAHPRVEMRGWKPFDQLIEEYEREGHVALDFMEHNAERELAFTTRTMIYLACGVPVIYNDFSEISLLIKEHGGGWLLPAGDVGAAEKLLKRLILSPIEIADESGKAKLLAARYSWDQTIQPLAAFCAAPKLRLKQLNHLQDLGGPAINSPSKGTFKTFTDMRQMYLPRPSRLLWPFVYVAAWTAVLFLRHQLLSEKSLARPSPRDSAL